MSDMNYLNKHILQPPKRSNIAMSSEGGAPVEDAYRTSQLNLRVSVGLGVVGTPIKEIQMKVTSTTGSEPTCCGRRRQPKEQRSATQMRRHIGGEGNDVQ
jgi:hypothetical protein